MNLDNFYNEGKSNYYLGLVSFINSEHVRIQIENLSILNPRILKGNRIIPNTIEFYVVIESVSGIYIGKVFENELKDSDNVHIALNEGKINNILPDIQVDMLACMPRFSNAFKLMGVNSVGLGDKAYLVSDKLMDKYLMSLQMVEDKDFLSGFAQTLNLNRNEFNIGVNTLLNRHLMVIGKTGSGKSTSALSILGQLVGMEKKVLIIDPTGEYKNSFHEDEMKKVVLGEDTFISTGQVSMSQWAIVFETNESTQPTALFEAIKALRFQHEVGLQEPYVKLGKNIDAVLNELENLSDSKKFNLALLPDQLAKDCVEPDRRSNSTYVESPFTASYTQTFIDKVNYKLENSSFVKLFQESDNTEDLISVLNNFIGSSKSLYIDASHIDTSDSAGGMVVDLVANYLLDHPNREYPFVFFVDEAHRYTRNTTTEDNAFFTGLTTIAREGRKNGQYLFLTTQSPKDVDNFLLSQMGTLLIHRLTYQEDLKIVSNFLNNGVGARLRSLDNGEAILTGINLLQDVYLKIKPSTREHLNESPML